MFPLCFLRRAVHRLPAGQYTLRNGDQTVTFHLDLEVCIVAAPIVTLALIGYLLRLNVKPMDLLIGVIYLLFMPLVPFHVYR